MKPASQGAGSCQIDERAELRELCNDYRTARLNEKYYGWRLHSIRSQAFAIDFVSIAVGSVASFIIIGIEVFAHQEEVPHWLWPSTAGVAAFLAMIKPIFSFESKVERYTKLLCEYGAQTAELKRILGRVHAQHGFTKDLRERLENIRNAHVSLVHLEDPHPNRGRLEEFQEEVKQEIPAGSLFWPEGEKFVVFAVTSDLPEQRDGGGEN